MTTWQSLILAGMGFLCACWVVRHLFITFVFAHSPVLTEHSPRWGDGAPPPRVTAIVPAKDEESTLPDCLDSVLAQDLPGLELLVVDDRSTDRTGEVARAYARRDPRVRVLTIDHLPPGWTGKTHALHVAAARASGDWLWFLDADTRHHPACLSIVLAYARDQGAKLVSLLPEMRCETFWERVVQPLAGIVLMRSFPPILVNDDRRKDAFANGQFILIARAAYEAAGGHEAVRDRFVEDIYLAKRVKALGIPIRTAFAPRISSTRMYTSLPQIIRGWSRIYYDAHGRRIAPIVGKFIEPLIFSQSGQLAFLTAIGMLATGAVTGPFPVWLLGLASVHLALSHSVVARMYRMSGLPARWVAFYALAGLVLDVIYARSIWSCLTGRVTWRGTEYGPEPEANPRPAP